MRSTVGSTKWTIHRWVVRTRLSDTTNRQATPTPSPASLPICRYCGRFAYSSNLKDWHFSAPPAYNSTVTYRTGARETFLRRERPQIIFIEGEPAFLITGVCLCRLSLSLHHLPHRQRGGPRRSPAPTILPGGFCLLMTETKAGNQFTLGGGGGGRRG